jgi:hypothetical protein
MGKGTRHSARVRIVDGKGAAMASVLGWLDQSEAHQRRMREVIDLFSETEARDELGIGVVRDAFADLLFPGLSTVQTRARYFLFVPWVHLHMEKKRFPAAVMAQRARDWQWRLVQSLDAGGENTGVIGIEAGHGVKRLPTSVYWNGLAVLGIRLFNGGINDYYRGIDRFHERSRAREYRGDDPGDDRAEANWQRALPAAPDGLFDSVTFGIEPWEADYLIERFRFDDKHSAMTAALSGSGLDVDAHAPWAAMAPAGLDDVLAERLRYAEYFSTASHGAALLYNLLLAEASAERGYKDSSFIEEYRERLDEWGHEMGEASAKFSTVERSRFWQLVWSRAKVPQRTSVFVDKWLDRAGGDPLSIAEDADARALIRDRELTLKRSAARLHNNRSLELWNGAAGTARLTYRWSTAQRMLADILGEAKHAQS